MFGMGYCLKTTFKSFSNFLRTLSTFSRAAAQDGHWKSPNSTSTVLADVLPLDQPSGVMTGLFGDATVEDEVGIAGGDAEELSEAVRFTRNMAVATARTTSAARAIKGLARERLAGCEGFPFPDELGFFSFERFMQLRNSLDRFDVEANIVSVASDSVGACRTELERVSY